MTAKRNDLMTISDAAGIMTAERNSAELNDPMVPLASYLTALASTARMVSISPSAYGRTGGQSMTPSPTFLGTR